MGLLILTWIAMAVPLPLGLFASFKTIEAIVDKNDAVKNKWMACAVIALTLAPIIWLLVFMIR